MTQFSLVTYWHLDAAIEGVWEVLVAVEAWPRWWRYVREVVTLEEGDVDGVGSLRRYTWSSKLPYRLTFEMRATAIERPTLIEGIAVGDLNGIGRWQLRGLGESCCVRYEWAVGTGRTWMNRLGPILAPVFEWNHNQVMLEGGRGLARHLGVALLGAKGSSARLRGLPDAKYDP
jgi:hypothetical protein